MLSKDPGLWNSGLLGSSTTSTGAANPNTRAAAGIGTPSATVTTASNTSYAFLASSASSVLLQGTTNGISNNPTTLMPATVSHDRSQELCKYFLNGGCLRGAQCQYLHELPDERHLDVNGYGYILNPNVHNAQKTLPLAVSNNTTSAVQVNGGAPTSSPLMLGLNTGSSRQSHSAKTKPQASLLVGVPTHLPFQLSVPSVKAPPPKYRPPEPFLEYNLPPTLALPIKTPAKDVALQLTNAMLKN
ncbi:uncharacterized protein TM35_000331210 [Trypanosoma theileri]|uniref:C3H1-type domain-containing protein n=1 Tax=Trypanosoma theileri TaxID=67003 RepID=A0A1X0NLP8_9TRYP|nr:uncharacterized protein TM35_000331210 [Trypanosoma theileri]ORC85664.1 hypothetical protein TM35_000331210 [Trypanosoma theileri]